jgi:DNA mismatch endonuclease (patch repair protein)
MEKLLKNKLRGGKFINVTSLRSKMMSAVRGKNNRSTERRLRMELVRIGIKGWKLHAKTVPGSPDIYFPRRKMAIFVDGCFWHGCPNCGHIPKTRRPFWKMKIVRNRERDRKTTRILEKQSIKVIRTWECQIKNSTRELIKKIVSLSG